MKLGELLRDERIITAEQLETALARQNERGGMLGAILVELGFVDQHALAMALVRKYGIESVDLEQSPPDPRLASRFFLTVPRTRSAALKCCPLELAEGRRLKLAMADPTDVVALDEIRSRTGLAIEPVYAPAAAILDALRALGPRSRPYIPLRPSQGGVDLITGTDTGTLEISGRRVSGADFQTAGEGYLAGAIVVDATRRGASDVHVERYSDWSGVTTVRVRYRIQGVLHVTLQKRFRSGERPALHGLCERLLTMVGEADTFEARFLSGGERVRVEYEVSGIELVLGTRVVLRRRSISGLDTTFVPPTENERERALLAAAACGDAPTLSTLLAEGVPPDASQSGYTAMMAAARGGHVPVIDALVEAGADPRRRDREHDAMMMAAYLGRTEAVGKLTRLGAFVETSQTNALTLAAGQGELATVRMLLAEGSPDRSRAVDSATRYGHNEVLEELLSDYSPDDVAGTLCHAASVANVEAVELLIDRAPKPVELSMSIAWAIRGARESRSRGAFFCTIASRRVPPGSLRSSVPRERALEDALAARYGATLRALALAATEQGAPLAESLLTGCLKPAIATGNAHLVRALLEAGADPGGARDVELSPLAFAVQSGETSSVEALLDGGAELTRDALESSGRLDRGGLMHALRSRERIRWRPSDLPAMLRFAESEGHADFPERLARFGSDQLDRDLAHEALEVARRGGQVLDLSERLVKRLPEAVFENDALAVLNLSFNRIEELPHELGTLRKLEALNLFGNRIRELPASLEELPKLRWLDMGNNGLDEVPETVTRLSVLTSLNLRLNRLEVLPHGLAGLESLSELDLSHNRLAELPEVVAKLPRLERLRVDGNDVALLGKVSGCASLKELSLQNCTFRGLPANLRRMWGLELLRLDGTPVERLPEWIGELSSLRVLSVRNAGLTTLPREIAALSHLKVLDVSNNGLLALGDELAELRALEVLDVTNNRIRRLPESVTSMSLRRLSVDGNPLEIIDPSRIEPDGELEQPSVHEPPEPTPPPKEPTPKSRRRRRRHR